MVEYIDRQSVYDVLRKSPISNMGTKLYIYDDIADIPAADVAERKRGKWIVMNDEYVDACKCSECGCIEYFNKGWKRFNFCPNCGAAMKGE